MNHIFINGVTRSRNYAVAVDILRVKTFRSTHVTKAAGGRAHTLLRVRAASPVISRAIAVLRARLLGLGVAVGAGALLRHRIILASLTEGARRSRLPRGIFAGCTFKTRSPRLWRDALLIFSSCACCACARFMGHVPGPTNTISRFIRTSSNGCFPGRAGDAALLPRAGLVFSCLALGTCSSERGNRKGAWRTLLAWTISTDTI